VIALLALAENNAGRKKEGLEHAIRAAELAPGRSDVLDILAQLQAFSGKCDDALIVEQRAIDALPDSAPASIVATLNQRFSRIPDLCAPSLEQRIIVKPVLRGCGRAPVAKPKDRVKGAIEAEFNIHEDGTVADVSITGSAAAPFLLAVKRYFQSCVYEPPVVDGKPQAVRSGAKVTFGESR